MITPRLIIQNAASFNTPVIWILLFFISEKITDMEINDNGNEKLRKKVFSWSFSMANQCINTELRMTGLESISDRERQSKADW